MGGDGWIHLLHEQPELLSCVTRIIATPSSNDILQMPEIEDFFPLPEIALNDGSLIIGGLDDPVIREEPLKLKEYVVAEVRILPGCGHFMPQELHEDWWREILDLGPQWESWARGGLDLPYGPGVTG
ncbi:hypothetical protein HOG48_04160 [Candidatus Peregrinibacteria bacterium]|nr:hypothetical protein [Candidatus Peregrinibacteria bacterium]